MTTHIPLRLPESMTRVDIGPYMRGLREHFGLSQQDVSERLHIRTRYIQAIETGQLEQMPGQAYAKGYVGTYAEFLGLDAEQVVAICFGPEPVREQQRHFVPAPARAKQQRGLPGAWRSYLLMGVAVGVLVLGVVQFFSGDDVPDSAPTVADVPEDMLADMRNMVMPTASNGDCLRDATPLGCLLDGRDWQAMQQWLAVPIYYFADVTYAPSMDKQDAKPEVKPEEAKLEPSKSEEAKPEEPDAQAKAATAEKEKQAEKQAEKLKDIEKQKAAEKLKKTKAEEKAKAEEKTKAEAKAKAEEKIREAKMAAARARIEVKPSAAAPAPAKQEAPQKESDEDARPPYPGDRPR